MLDAKLEIESLKSTPTISDEIECSDCDVFHAELKELREKYASKIDEIDRLKVELAELKSRPALLGACTSCPILHGKLNESLEHATSLEAALKSPISTACSSCETVSSKNIELESRFNFVYEENDYMRKLLGWLSGHEPQLVMLIGEYKRADGHSLGFEKVGECSGEREREECELHLLQPTAE